MLSYIKDDNIVLTVMRGKTEEDTKKILTYIRAMEDCSKTNRRRVINDRGYKNYLSNPNMLSFSEDYHAYDRLENTFQYYKSKNLGVNGGYIKKIDDIGKIFYLEDFIKDAMQYSEENKILSTSAELKYLFNSDVIPNSIDEIIRYLKIFNNCSDEDKKFLMKSFFPLYYLFFEEYFLLANFEEKKSIDLSTFNCFIDNVGTLEKAKYYDSLTKAKNNTKILKALGIV